MIGGKVIFKLTIGIKAVSKQRPRSAKSGHFYTPPKTREYERQIREAAKVVVVQEPCICPIGIRVEITEKPPKSWPKWKHHFINVLSPKRGDLDNKVKAVSDALNGLVFVDDIQINTISASMRYGERNCVSVTVYQTGLSEAEAKEKYEQDRRGSTRMGG